MKIELTSDMFNEMIKFVSNFVARGKKARPMLTYILLEVENKRLKVTGCDGIKLGQITFSGDWEDGSMIMPLVKRVKVKETDYVNIIEDGKNIILETEVDSQIYKKTGSKFFNYEEVLPTKNPKETFRMRAGNIADALKAFPKNEYVDIDYRGELDPLVIRGQSTYAMVLPVRGGKR